MFVRTWGGGFKSLQEQFEVNMISITKWFEDAIAEADDHGTYTVYMNGNNKTGKIYNCNGNNEFEAIEDAYMFYQDLFMVINT